MGKSTFFWESKIQSFKARTIICVGAFLVYALIFNPLYPLFSRATIGLVTLPILITASMLGLWGGFIAGLISIPTNILLFVLAGERNLASFSLENLGMAHIVLVGFGFVAGYLLDHRTKPAKELIETKLSNDSLQESEAYYRSIVTQASDGIVLYDLETEQVLETNHKYQEMLGYTAEEIRRLSIYDIVTHDRKQLKRFIQRFRSEDLVWMNECQHKRKDGSLLDVEVSSRLININAKEILSTVVRDITRRKQTERELAASKEKYKLVVESTMEVVLTVDKLGIIRFCNSQIEKTYGHAVSEVLGKSFTNFAPKKEWSKYFSKLNELFQNKEIASFETVVYHKDGRIILVEMSGRLIRQDGKWVVVSVIKDITERKRLEQELQHAATHDSLTNLPNRALFDDRLKNALSKAERNKEKLAVLFIDLDDFKAVNDTYGHYIGDQLLIAFTQRLQNLFRKSDTIARLSGDEFAFIIDDLSEPVEAARIAKKINAHCSEPYKLEDYDISTTLSIGISIYPDDASDADTLLQRADAAMYQVKQVGKDNYRFFNKSVNDAL